MHDYAKYRYDLKLSNYRSKVNEFFIYIGLVFLFAFFSLGPSQFEVFQIDKGFILFCLFIIGVGILYAIIAATFNMVAYLLTVIRDIGDL